MQKYVCAESCSQLPFYFNLQNIPPKLNCVCLTEYILRFGIFDILEKTFFYVKYVPAGPYLLVA